MLGEGVRAGFEHMGINTRCVCYVEREAYAAAVLVARMESGALDTAPVWSDVCTFDAGRWRGAVDCVVAGFPCQDLSLAGKRAGLDGARSGLFFEVLRIADDCGAWAIVLENVAGIASATASVVDEAEGELDERAAARVVGELADRGWNAEWLTLSASDVGASHARDRWFCFAWRSMGDAGLQHQHVQQWPDGAKPARTGLSMADPERISSERQGDAGDVACTSCEAEREARERQRRRPAADGGCGSVADANGIGRREESYRELKSSRVDRRGVPIFAPGPDAPEWEWIIKTSPWLSPALEPDFRQLVDGVAFDMGDSRSARLRCVGNGVVPLQAAAALVVLARRAGFFD